MRQPNDALARLVTEAGCSWAGLARRVNDLGAAEGLALTYDYTAVHRWIKKGERPRAESVPRLIAQALSEMLARCVNPADFGMSADASIARRSLEYQADMRSTLDTLADLGRADVNRRAVVTAAPFVLASMVGPSRDWLLGALDETTGERGPRRVGTAQVSGIREMFKIFQELDVMRGGGHARVALLAYLDGYVMPVARRQHESAVQKALYEAAAEQAYLVGWMAYDDGLNGLAQRYLIQALRLAQASGDAALGAHVLAGMSDQANLLGHPKEALALARSGRRGIAPGDSPACTADLHILEARALAAQGESRQAATSVAAAEAVFGRVVAENEPEWARFIDAAYLFGEAAQTFRDTEDWEQVERFAAESVAEAAKQDRARRGALSEAALAVAQLGRGEVEAAARHGRHVVDLTATVESSRCVEAVEDIRRRLRPYASVAAVQAFDAHARTSLGLAS